MNVSSRDDSIQSTLRDVEEAFSYLGITIELVFHKFFRVLK